MLRLIRIIIKILFNFPNYEPQPVTIKTLWYWINQFPYDLRLHLLLVLDKIDFFSKKEVKNALIDLNNEILRRLNIDGVDIKHVIYISIDKTGSSSHVMLNILRDNANLERQGAILLDSNDIQGLNIQSYRLQTGAIIYVDDFSGTGKQFCRNRRRTAEYIIGNFSEFFLAPCMCEEAMKEIRSIGVEPVTNKVHNISDRPLHSGCHSLNPNIKKYMIEQANKINPSAALGFGDLATMVVLYRNAPNTMSLIFRGSLGQSPYKGIFPRMDDLPIRKSN